MVLFLNEINNNKEMFLLNKISEFMYLFCGFLTLVMPSAAIIWRTTEYTEINFTCSGCLSLTKYAVIQGNRTQNQHLINLTIFNF